jgi:hypothetical protein
MGLIRLNHEDIKEAEKKKEVPRGKGSLVDRLKRAEEEKQSRTGGITDIQREQIEELEKEIEIKSRQLEKNDGSG